MRNILRILVATATFFVFPAQAFGKINYTLRTPKGPVASKDSNGARVNWSLRTKSNVRIHCSHRSGDVYRIGRTLVRCHLRQKKRRQLVRFALVIRDQDRPQISIVAPDKVSVDGPGQLVSPKITFSDRSDKKPSLECSHKTPVYLSLGRHMIKCKVKDHAGNSSEAFKEITVIDDIAPKLEVPTSMNAEATSKQGSPVDIEANAVDGNGVSEVACKGSPIYPIGITNVICMAEDLFGNRSESVIEISVVDTIKPEIIGSDRYHLQGAHATELSDWPQAKDLGEDLDLDCNYDEQHLFAIGSHQLICEAKDQSGNTSTRAFDVFIHDEAEPANIQDTIFAADLDGPVKAFGQDTLAMQLEEGDYAQRMIEGDEIVYKTDSYHVRYQQTLGRLKENIHVFEKQGNRTWNWSFASVLEKQDDGSIKIADHYAIEPVKIFDDNGADITPEGLSWQVQGSNLSLVLDDSNFPTPYIIDPTILGPALSFTQTPDDATRTQFANFAWDQTPDVVSTYCYFVNNLTNQTQKIDPCNSSYSSAGLMHGNYGFQVIARLADNTTFSIGKSWWVDLSPPLDFTLNVNGSQSLPDTSFGYWPTCTQVPQATSQKSPGLAFSQTQDPESGMGSYEIYLNGALQTSYAQGTTLVHNYVGPPLNSGLHTWRVKALSRSGASTERQAQFIMHTQGPGGDMTSPLANEQVSRATTFSWNISDEACEGGAILYIDAPGYPIGNFERVVVPYPYHEHVKHFAASGTGSWYMILLDGASQTKRVPSTGTIAFNVT